MAIDDNDGYGWLGDGASGRTGEPDDSPTATGYNGWSNHSTWAANLWLSNDEPTYRAAIATLRGVTSARLAGQRLRLVWRSFLPMSAKREARPSSAINWTEIGAAWLEDKA
jgi:hypothetical protein